MYRIWILLAPAVPPVDAVRPQAASGRTGSVRPLSALLAFLISLAALGAPSVAAAGRLEDGARQVLARADTLFVARKPDSALALLSSLLEESRRRGEADLTAAVLVSQGRILATVGRAGPAEAALREALLRVSAQGDTLQLCRTLRWLAYTLSLQGRMPESSAHYRRLLDLARSRRDRDHEAYARLGLAYADLMDGRVAEAREGYTRALALFRDLGNQRFALISLTGLGRAFNALGNLEQGRVSYQKVAEESRRIGDPFTQADALNNLGAIEFSMGDPREAVRLYRQAYDLQRANGNPEGSLIPAKNLAVAETHMGWLGDAEAILLEALDLCRSQGYGGRRAILLEQLGIVRRQQRRFPEAASRFREALGLGPAVSLEDRARLLFSLAETMALMDSARAGLSLLDGESALMRARVSAPIRARTDRAAGELLLKLGRLSEALVRLRRADSTASALGLTAERVAPLASSTTSTPAPNTASLFWRSRCQASLPGERPASGPDSSVPGG